MAGGACTLMLKSPYPKPKCSTHRWLPIHFCWVTVVGEGNNTSSIMSDLDFWGTDAHKEFLIKEEGIEVEDEPGPQRIPGPICSIFQQELGGTPILRLCWATGLN
ncbi:hypothetical protein JRQ81_005655 [Phrynocephalus forsythii]|uniref:Uncharacterized protein n=1 Tax=Phrynocephalus forsythii TaxID=171643 RepID=A0A9Q0Y3V5_9SAUR|nr:hypothetical protein JRQ81_005655 [Phrynocephalus forsythii]